MTHSTPLAVRFCGRSCFLLLFVSLLFIIHSSLSTYMLPQMKCLVYVALAASLATTAQAGGAVELSEDNFGKKMAGKHAFVKFLAPVSSMPSELPLAWKGKVPTLHVCDAGIMSNHRCILLLIRPVTYADYLMISLCLSLFSLSLADG